MGRTSPDILRTDPDILRTSTDIGINCLKIWANPNWSLNPNETQILFPYIVLTVASLRVFEPSEASLANYA